MTTLPQSQDAPALAEALALRCAQATLHGATWQACCPAHDDTHPSLSITPSNDRVLMHCFTGCAPEAILAALGLESRDLFVVQRSRNGHKRISHVYAYVDASGQVLHETVRYEPKAFRQRRPDPVHPGQYVWSLKGIEPVLYNLPAVLAALRTGAPIHLSEGEKDAETLMALGLVGTTVPMGAKYWRTSYTTLLTGAHVLVWPDNDAAGQDSLTKVTRHLTGKAQTLRLVQVPATYKDVSDWIQAGGTRAEVDALIAAATAPPAVVATPRPVPTDTDPPLPYSDYTNALAFVRDHGQDLRYCYPWNAWLVWTGTHWQRDTSGAVMRLAKQTVKRLARQIEALDDKKQIAALMAHVKASLSTAKLKALVENAQSEPGIAVQPADLDTNPWLLNCANGTLDLRTGTLSTPHQQADLMTKCLVAEYDPQASCPTWGRFLWRIMGGSQGPDDPDMSVGELAQRQQADARATALIAYLQRAAGYTLTGSTREQCLFFCYGPTKTGKSTYLAMLRHLLGPYGKQTDMQTFLHKDRPEVRNDLADLAGTRYVYAVESQEGKRLAEGLVKQMTGGVDAMKARFLYEELFEFRPMFKAYIGTNHAPQIQDSDDAIWERIRRIPFTVQIPKAERNKDLEEALLKELPGMLAWAVQGCLAWQEAGDLKEPQAVIDSTQGYRDEMDDVGRFLTEVCALGDGDIYKTQASALLQAYHRWLGQPSMTAKAFNRALTDRNYVSKRFTTGMFWLGIGLQAPEEPGRDK